MKNLYLAFAILTLPLFVLPLLGSAVFAMSKQVPDTPPAAELACDAAQWQHLMGQTYVPDAPFELPENARVLRPGQAMTMDHNPRRLNFELDINSMVARIWCG